MREILFRGKSSDNGEWLYGMPIKTHIGIFIVYEENPHYCGQYGYMEIDGLGKVDSDTVGQYTGLKDRSGKKIFEGDILLLPGYYMEGREFPGLKSIVVWNDGGWELKETNECIPSNVLDHASATCMEVIGNDYDNTELPEVEE